MQTLGLADSTPRSENRLKSLFWPSIQNATDVDYLSTQGYWICTAVAVGSLIFLTISGHAIAGFFTFLFYFLSAIGVREGSRYAAILAFGLFLLDLFLTGPNVVRVIFTTILLSNVRATWIASRWRPESDEAEPAPRLNETLGDKLADQLPKWLWPKVRIGYYIFSAAMLTMIVLGAVIIKLRH